MSSMRGGAPAEEEHGRVEHWQVEYWRGEAPLNLTEGFDRVWLRGLFSQPNRLKLTSEGLVRE